MLSAVWDLWSLSSLIEFQTLVVCALGKYVVQFSFVGSLARLQGSSSEGKVGARCRNRARGRARIRNRAMVLVWRC